MIYDSLLLVFNADDSNSDLSLSLSRSRILTIPIYLKRNLAPASDCDLSGWFLPVTIFFFKNMPGSDPTTWLGHSFHGPSQRGKKGEREIRASSSDERAAACRHVFRARAVGQKTLLHTQKFKVANEDRLKGRLHELKVLGCDCDSPESQGHRARPEYGIRTVKECNDCSSSLSFLF